MADASVAAALAMANNLPTIGAAAAVSPRHTCRPGRGEGKRRGNAGPSIRAHRPAEQQRVGLLLTKATITTLVAECDADHEQDHRRDRSSAPR
jgi:hypothetical protein